MLKMSKLTEEEKLTRQLVRLKKVIVKMMKKWKQTPVEIPESRRRELSKGYDKMLKLWKSKPATIPEKGEDTES